MIGLTVDAGDHFKKRAAIPLAPCMCVLTVTVTYMWLGIMCALTFDVTQL